VTLRARTRALLGVALATASLFAPRGARATGFTDIGQDITPREKVEAKITGYLRTRGEAFYNLDLDRGLTPSGQPLFPVSSSDPSAQTFTNWDMRLRTDLAVYAPGEMVAVKARIDFLDNLVLGSMPEGIPGASTTQRATGDMVRVKRAYGEAKLPFGVLAAGRMGAHWGLGMLSNGGDCLDCDSGDSADRLALLTALAGHIFAVAYDFSATGPQTPRGIQGKTIGFEPSTDVRSVTFAVLRWTSDEVRERRSKAGKGTVEYGSFIAHRWQSNDVPATYLPLAQPASVSSSQIMSRGYRATALDAWAKVVFPSVRIEAEFAYLAATVDQPSLLPGVLLRQPAQSRQIGAAIESQIGAPESAFGGGLDAGYASGDPAPGFGANPAPNAPAPKPGDLDGAQASPPRDLRVDNFRFHPDYRVDRILFREIIGTVTDAVYARPHVKLRLFQTTSGAVTASLAAIASFAMFASSTPGGKRPLGVELDPTIAYEGKDGLAVALEHAILFPLAGLDNTAANLAAKPAQLVRLRLAYRF
jgi:uncharacterized protein (TIGR04551 family)